MYVRMRHRLACSLAHVDSDVESMRSMAALDGITNDRDKRPQCSQLVRFEFKQIRNVPAWNHQSMPWIERKSVGNSHREGIRGNGVFLVRAGAKRTPIQHGFVVHRCTMVTHVSIKGNSQTLCRERDFLEIHGVTFLPRDVASDLHHQPIHELTIWCFDGVPKWIAQHRGFPDLHTHRSVRVPVQPQARSAFDYQVR